MPELIFYEFKGSIILAGRFRTGSHFTFVATFYLLFDKPKESFPKLPTSLNDRYYSEFSIKTISASSANICRNQELKDDYLSAVCTFECAGLRLSVKFVYMSTQRCDTFESESDPERCRWNNLIEMKANIHSAISPINKKDIEMLKYLSKVDL